MSEIGSLIIKFIGIMDNINVRANVGRGSGIHQTDTEFADRKLLDLFDHQDKIPTKRVNDSRRATTDSRQPNSNSDQKAAPLKTFREQILERRDHGKHKAQDIDKSINESINLPDNQEEILRDVNDGNRARKEPRQPNLSKKTTSTVSETSTEHVERRNRGNKKAQDISESSDRTKRPQSPFPPFEYHYDLSKTDSLLRILQTIQGELASHSYIHDWDEKLKPDPVKSLALFARQALGRWGFDSGSHILAFSNTDRIVTINGTVWRQRVDPDSSESKGYPFSHGVHEALPTSSDEATSGPRLNYGRVV